MIFSNEPQPITFLTPFVAYASPDKRFSIDELKSRMSSEKNYLIWHKRHWRTYLYGLNDLNANYKLRLIKQLPDSLIFEIE